MLCRYQTNKIYSITPTVEADAAEPVTLAEAKAQCIVDFADDDAYITALISQCRDGIEQYCNISMIIKELVIHADLVEEIEIPYGPIDTVDTVMYRNGGTYEATTDFTTDGDSGMYMRFIPGAGGRYKITCTTSGIEMINYQSLKLDHLRTIAYCYDHRGDGALNSLQAGINRPKGLDEALELFAGKYRRYAWL